MAEKLKAASAGLHKEALHKHTQAPEEKVVVKEEKSESGLIKVRNLDNRPLYLANGVIPALGEGYATRAELSTLRDHIEKV